MSRCNSLVRCTVASLFLLSFVFFGLFSLPAYAEVPAKVRIGIITNNSGSQYRSASSITFSAKGSYQIIDLSAFPGDDLLGSPVEGELWQVYYLPSGMQIYQNGQSLSITTGPVIIKETEHNSANQICLVSYSSAGSNVNISKWYRGNMEFRSTNETVIAVNELPMDEYLYGVVPREMSNSWPLEALKAQAIAARTYVVANYNRRILEGFNVLDTPYDQAYGGCNGEGDNATRSVTETTGEILLYKGKPISAVYHSTSGGYTENNENVWGATPYEYLRGKQDPYSTKYGLANWTYTTTINNVRNKSVQSGSQIAAIESIELEKYQSGRVKTVIIQDINGNTIKKSGSDFGKMFNPSFYTYIGNTNFMSNFFNVKMDQVKTPSYYVLNSTGTLATVKGTELYGITEEGNVEILNIAQPDFYTLDSVGSTAFNKGASGNVVFAGHGWGHGVGMSQWGAYDMAQQGKGYKEILMFYYTGVDISKDY